MKDTDFLRYSGPYDLITDSVARISDFFEELSVFMILSDFGYRLVRIIELDEKGDRKKYQDPLYYLVEKGENPPKPKMRHRLSNIKNLAKFLDEQSLDYDFKGLYRELCDRQQEEGNDEKT